MPTIRQKTLYGLSAGDQFVVTRTLTEKDVIEFAAITRDYNPIHFDDRFAETKNFNGRVCHGLLAGSLLTEIGGQIGWLATEMNFTFKKPVFFGDTIRCELTITEINKKGFACAEAIIKNQDGIIVIESLLKGFLPGKAEKEVMHQMMDKGDPSNLI